MLLLALLATLLLAGAAQADNPSRRLFPGPAPSPVPGSAGRPERDTRGKDGNLTSTTDVSVPTLTIYPPAPDKLNTQTLVIIAPGGGYHGLSVAQEGTDIARWLNGLGVTAAVLKYRVPVASCPRDCGAPLIDAQRAVGIARQNASAWGVTNLTHLGFIGFSAGGHLTAHLTSVCNKTSSHHRLYPRIDAADDLSCAPDFQLMSYPAYLTPDKPYLLAPEISVGQNATVPTFLDQ